MVRLSIRGTGDFDKVSRRLNGASRSMRTEFYKAINRATKPLKAAVRRAAKADLPRRGGLGARVARSKITTRRRTTGKDAGVRIVGASGYDIGSINRGRVRHLTYGHLPWSVQAVKPGFWTEPLVAGAPAVRREIDEAMTHIARQIEKG